MFIYHFSETVIFGFIIYIILTLSKQYLFRYTALLFLKKTGILKRPLESRHPDAYCSANMVFVKEYDRSVLKVCCSTPVLENPEMINRLLLRISSGYFQVLYIIMNTQSVQNGEKNSKTIKAVDTQTPKHNKVAQNQTLSCTYLQKKKRKKKKNTPCLYCTVNSIYLRPDDLMTPKEKEFLAFLHWHVLISVHYCFQTRLCYNFTLGPLEDINQICNCFSVRDCSLQLYCTSFHTELTARNQKKAEDFILFIRSEDIKKSFCIFCRSTLFNTEVKLHIMVCKIFCYIHVIA